MVNEQKNNREAEHSEIGRLLGGLNRVEAPADFDFHVRARIAKGRPAGNRSSWFPASVRLAVPLGLFLTVGGYIGFSTIYSPNQANIPVAAPEPSISQALPAVPSSELVSAPPVRAIEMPSVTTLAEVRSEDQATKINKTAQKIPAASSPKTEKPGGGSYVDAGTAAKTITQPDIDDNEPAPTAKVIVPASQFLSSAGIISSGGKITSVSGAAASAGLRAGDVIEAVNVQTGSVRVGRDGKSLTVKLK